MLRVTTLLIIVLSGIKEHRECYKTFYKKPVLIELTGGSNQVAIKSSRYLKIALISDLF